MATWWLAIDRQYTSYDELKHRKIVAQGWPDLGNLLTLCALVGAGDRNTFMQTVTALECIAYGNSTHAARVMWDLLSMRAEDLVVGIEGTTVKGICQLKENGWDSYQHHSPEAYNYAQTIGFPVEWIDWDVHVFGFTQCHQHKVCRELQGCRMQVNRSPVPGVSIRVPHERPT